MLQPSLSAQLRKGVTAIAVALALLVLAYAGLLAWAYCMQERMIFPAPTLAQDHQFRFDQPFEEMRIEVQGESEAQLHDDVRAAWEFVSPRYSGKPMAGFGRSLGAGLATRVAADVAPALVVLVSPFTSDAHAARCVLQVRAVKQSGNRVLRTGLTLNDRRS